MIVSQKIINQQNEDEIFLVFLLQYSTTYDNIVKYQLLKGMNNMLMTVITEMVDNAAKEIGWPVDFKNVEQILEDLENHYSRIITQETSIDWHLMTDIIEVIFEWQINHKKTPLYKM